MIKAIETRYAGHRFRSRLEARWSVFLTTLGIRWQYEPQGYLVGTNPQYCGYGPSRAYLPDFWLPELRLWVEVKGTEDAIDWSLLLDATIPHWGLPASPEGGEVDSEYGPRLLILGPVPSDDDPYPAHAVLTWWKGLVFEDFALFGDGGDIGVAHAPHRPVGGDCLSDYSANRTPLTEVTFTPASRDRISPTGPRVRQAYAAARSARFEHGESG